MTDLPLIFSAAKVPHGLSVVECPALMTVCVCAHACACLRVHACVRTALGSLNELTMIPYLDLSRQTIENFYVEG